MTASVEQQRKIVTAIPGPKSQELHARRAAVVSGGVGTALGVYIDRAHGAVIVDVDGNHFLDFGGGIGVTTIGHTNDAVVAAAQEQLARVTHTLFTVTPYEEYVRVCELLAKHTRATTQRSLFSSIPALKPSRTASRLLASTPVAARSLFSNTHITVART